MEIIFGIRNKLEELWYEVFVILLKVQQSRITKSILFKIYEYEKIEIMTMASCCYGVLL